MMTLSLTFDHRAVDGAPAAVLVESIAGYLQRSDWLS
jgi:pyruvate/2-oxoglutarate dehydrogenase complex dihydrolipoamide acyltransferase (E2) component